MSRGPGYKRTDPRRYRGRGGGADSNQVVLINCLSSYEDIDYCQGPSIFVPSYGFLSLPLSPPSTLCLCLCLRVCSPPISLHFQPMSRRLPEYWYPRMAWKGSLSLPTSSAYLVLFRGVIASPAPTTTRGKGIVLILYMGRARGIFTYPPTCLQSWGSVACLTFFQEPRVRKWSQPRRYFQIKLRLITWLYPRAKLVCSNSTISRSEYRHIGRFDYS